MKARHPNGIAAMGDGHGNALWSSRALTLSRQASLVVPLGDLIDRHPNGLKSVKTEMELTRGKKMVPLWGNHELNFVLAMRGSLEGMFNWILNKGDIFILERFPENRRKDFPHEEMSYKFFTCFARGKDEDLEVRPWVKKHRISRKLIFRLIMGKVLSDREFRYAADWMAENLRLYYIDEYGTLYMHAGLRFLLSLPHSTEKGRTDKDRLDIMQAMISKALVARTFDPDAAIFDLLLGQNKGFLDGRHFGDDGSFIPGLVPAVEGLKSLTGMNVKRVVMAHDPLPCVLNMADTFFFTDLSSLNGIGSFHIAPGWILLESAFPDKLTSIKIEDPVIKPL